MPNQQPLQPDFFPLQPGDSATLFALMEMIRVQTGAMERNNEKMERLSSAVAQVREDIAVLKSDAQRDAELNAEVATLKSEVAALKLRNAQQDGGLKFITVVKDFSPWIVAGLMALIAYLKA